MKILLRYFVAFIRWLDMKYTRTTHTRSAYLQHTPQQQKKFHGNSAKGAAKPVIKTLTPFHPSVAFHIEINHMFCT